MDYAKTIYGLSLGVGKSDAGSHVMAGYQTPAGVNTAEDVKKLQTQLGVRADGIWGKETDGAYKNRYRQDERGREIDRDTLVSAPQIVTDAAKGIVAEGRFSRYQPLTTGKTSMVFGIKDMALGKEGKGLAILRIDQPHGEYNYPHLNVNIKAPVPNVPWKGKMPQNHTPISNKVITAAKTANKTTKILKTGGKALGYASLALDAYDIYNATQEDGKKFGNNTATAIGGAVGSWGGAALGAKAGAIGGAAIGSVVPVVGTAICGLIGGFVGGIVGAFAGRKLGEFTGDYMYDGEAVYNGRVYRSAQKVDPSQTGHWRCIL